MGRRLLFDIETDGLLDQLTRIHCLWIMDIDTDEVWDFARSDERDDIEEGLKMLSVADVLIGHNIMDFDLPAILKVYPDFEYVGLIRDTLVMSRMMKANVKERDFDLVKRGKLPGRLTGAQGLEAWGYRLGQHKGDYAKEREEELKHVHREKGLPAPTKEEIVQYVWGEWNPQMHEYCGEDIKVNLALLDLLISLEWEEHSTTFEHQTHNLCVKMEQNGFPFNKQKAMVLAEKLQKEYDSYCASVIEEIGIWWRPARFHTTEDGLFPEYGEFDSRRTWGRVDIPKRTTSFTKSNKKHVESGEYDKMRANTIEGRPYVKVILKEFNPNSRPQIIDRLQVLYGWTPQDFTEDGTAIVDDEVLRNLAEHIPLASTFAEIFFLKKRLGQVADGKNAWLTLVKDDGAIHATTNCGGTVSGRATHARPNISQVPSVKMGETKDETKAREAAQRLKVAIAEFFYNEKKGEWKWAEKGREGEFGWESRELFEAFPGHKLVGCDLSGIEFRCLGNLTYPFDDGEIIDLVLNGDIHQHNANLAGISRGVAKTLLYACVDMETQALTREGWKHYHELRVGEDVLTYNIEKDIQEWKPIQHLHYVEDAERVRISGRGIDIVCTPDHRWPVYRDTTVNGVPTIIREYRRTDEFGAHIRVIANAPYADKDGKNAPPLKVSDKLMQRTWGCQKVRIDSVERGPVWCMTTENGSFVMRRGDFVTQTGNCMYGGGDAKLGAIVEPLASEARQRTLGKQLRQKLMQAMPSLKKAIEAIQKEARFNRGTIRGLDGRRLYVRSPHSALNLRLQSDGAMIAKKWILLVDEALTNQGWIHDPKHDYAFCAWSHDEIQVSVRERHAEKAAMLMEQMAPKAGEYFEFKCPVAAESKIGRNWAETH